MIKANELRVGNRLMYGTNPDPKENIIVTVETIGADGINHETIEDHPDEDALPYIDKLEYDALSGIPLTPEVLEKCGFEKTATGWEHQSVDGIELSDDLYPSVNNDEYRTGTVKIEYLHQLQNLYFAITGEELEAHYEDIEERYRDQLEDSYDTDEW